jgi:hypothetical protein
MLLTFVTAVSGLLLPGSINAFAWLAYLIARYMLEVVTHLGHWSGSTVHIPMTVWGATLWYAGSILGWYWWKGRKRNVR